MVQFYPWFKFSFLLFLGIVMYDNEFEQRKIEFEPRTIKPQHTCLHSGRGIKAQFKRRTSQDTNQNGRIKSMLSVTIEEVELVQLGSTNKY